MRLAVPAGSGLRPRLICLPPVGMGPVLAAIPVATGPTLDMGDTEANGAIGGVNDLEGCVLEGGIDRGCGRH
eukprot:10261114-Prorocentrum_lima.AAC.1